MLVVHRFELHTNREFWKIGPILSDFKGFCLLAYSSVGSYTGGFICGADKKLTDTLQGLLHSFSIKNNFYDKMELRLFILM